MDFQKGETVEGILLLIQRAFYMQDELTLFDCFFFYLFAVFVVGLSQHAVYGASRKCAEYEERHL